MLAGYTAGIVAFPIVDTPGIIFDTAVARRRMKRRLRQFLRTIALPVGLVVALGVLWEIAVAVLAIPALPGTAHAQLSSPLDENALEALRCDRPPESVSQ